MTFPEKSSIPKDETIVIALGDPGGIGTEITLKALASKKLPSTMKPLLVGCQKQIEETYRRLISQGINQIANPKDLTINNIPLNTIANPGRASKENGEASFRWLTRAIELTLQKNGRALVTAPIAKHSWHAAGHNYPGQTEVLAKLTNSQQATMLFTALSPHNNWRLNTLLATTHIPLLKLNNYLSPLVLEEKLNILSQFCKKFNKNPKLAVAGLNPHAGEEGLIGTEEKEWIKPVLDKWRIQNPDIKLEGPLPPDTCWLSAALSWQGRITSNTYDGILALYHDQGLIPIKLLAFDEAVNTTLGLPFFRTSPDHGTAFDIAGTGKARPNSMIAAIRTAWDLSHP
ncbi:4-hydroxythreonine-4-phosphate dehydrogenase PdxA [Prochlorococcus sp. MIT 1300]|uniref:4-hydroxythreonine-4-phosphate dehydrogenase PdxA n=1 Tax=Prochlorococcus sp. MIT 1300 TaxID=3096218 RepID=UPI002A765C06|nr:4-hydroxythreonine-4-phosphate dehydrogenase PdxA [Prochlorococcus sp. MIT 1300]